MFYMLKKVLIKNDISVNFSVVLLDEDINFLAYVCQVGKTFDFSLMGASSRSCKYVLNTLMQASNHLNLGEIFIGFEEAKYISAKIYF